MEPSVKAIPLASLHRELGAKFGPFAGYEMPIQYPAGLKAEHLHTRAQAGLFDVSHMGQLRVRAHDGTSASLQRALQAALPIDFNGWPLQLQKYSYLLNDAGGIEDDLMLVNCGSEIRIVVNAGNRDADRARLEQLCPALSFDWIDAALIALQGPAAETVLAALDPTAALLRFMHAAQLRLEGALCFTTRSGYTGEDGYEISLPLDAAERIVRRLLSDPRVAPIGLGARDTLRLEAGLPLHGHDITASTSPVEAGLAFAIPASRRGGGALAGGFPGAALVLAQLADGPTRRRVGLVSPETVPIRAPSTLLDATGAAVGQVTSGTVSPSLGQPILMAYVQTGAQPVQAVVRDRRPAVQTVPLPFVPKRYQR